MTKDELEEYRENFIEFHGARPLVFRVPRPIRVLNTPDSSNRRAYGGISWTEYWQAFTGHYSNALECSSCGKKIEAHANDKELQSHGGHVKIFESDNPDGFTNYITPLCRDCNHPNKATRPIRPGSFLVQEVDPTINSGIATDRE